MPRLSFFVGKGGVGKTTVSAACAMRTASLSKRSQVLLVSTDPAHSLSDVLELNLGASPKGVPIRKGGSLWAWELDSAKLFRNFLAEYKNSILEIVQRGSLFTAEEISPLLDSSLPGMAEIAALLAIRDAIKSKKYSHVVVDTAPFGHTLRLFALPEQFRRLLNFLELAASRDRVLAEHFGGAGKGERPELIGEWEEKVSEISSAFLRAEVFLVTTPEKFALNESARCIAELKASASGFELEGIVLNRAVLRPGKCAMCRSNAGRVEMAKRFLSRNFAATSVYAAEDPGFPIMGTESLLGFGEHIFGRKKLIVRPRRPPANAKRELKLVKGQWPELESRITLVLGKGGVGKTTISTGLGFHSRRMAGDPVEICSVDPAPSLVDIFETSIGETSREVLGDEGFRASQLDARALFREWVDELRNEVESSTSAQVQGVHLDLTFERDLLSALLDIVPPGLDEVLAILRISELRASAAGRIVIDMAPTGHALELLRMPEKIVSWARVLLKSLAAHRKLALARNAAVRVAELELHARELSGALRNSDEVSIFAVMLAEPLPDRETARLFDELRRLGLKPRALFVNRVAAAEDVVGCARCQSARSWQMQVLEGLRKRKAAKEIFAIRNFEKEIAGRRMLRAVTNELWQVN